MPIYKLALLVTGAVFIALGAWALGRYELVLSIKRDVPVQLRGALPVRVRIDESLDVGLRDDVAATVRLGRLRVPVNETIEVPLDTVLSVPLDSEIAIDQPLEIALTIPIETVLTEHELDLSQLVVPMDTDLFVDDVLDLSIVVPLDTEVKTTLGIVVPVKATVPVKARVPIKQKIHVRDQVALHFAHVRIPLHASIPIKATLPFKQTLRVRGTIQVPIQKRLSIPIHQVLHPNFDEPVPISVLVDGKLRVNLKTDVAADVHVDASVPTQLGAIHLPADSVSIVKRTQ